MERMYPQNGHCSRAPLTDEEENLLASSARHWDGLLRETQAVSLWSCCSFLLRVAIGTLIALQSFREGDETTGTTFRGFKGRMPVLVWLTTQLAGWILALLPSKILSNRCHGFAFSNPFLLFWVREKTMVIPNIPVRSCEYMMGRISLGTLVAIIPVHFVTLYSTAFFAQRLFPSWISSLALDPMEYSQGGDWLLDLVRQVAVTAAFTVAMLVVPVALQLNYLPGWLLIIILYPLFNFGVDESGMGESFAPNALLSLAVLEGRPSPALYHLVGSVLGGMLGGRIMLRYFPDETREGREKNE